MREYKDILQELQEYKEAKLKEVKKIFRKGDIIQTLDPKFKYEYGTIDAIFFDNETGEYYLYIKENKHSRVRWTSCSTKTSIHPIDFNLIQVVENPVDKHLNKLKLLQEYLDYKINNVAMTVSQREEKEWKIQKKIREIQHMCVHDWDEEKEGSWLNEKRVGYRCSICGLFDEDRE